jgi:CheY-like chemotaxis protein
MANLLLVDDEINPNADLPDMDYMWYYKIALEESGHSVTSTNSVDTAIRLLNKNPSRFQLAILDVMMRPGRALKDSKHVNGARSGIYLALRLAQEFPALKTVILTNSADPAISEQLRPVNNVCAILSKVDCLPEAFVEEINTVLASGAS